MWKHNLLKSVAWMLLIAALMGSPGLLAQEFPESRLDEILDRPGKTVKPTKVSYDQALNCVQFQRTFYTEVAVHDRVWDGECFTSARDLCLVEEDVCIEFLGEGKVFVTFAERRYGSSCQRITEYFCPDEEGNYVEETSKSENVELDYQTIDFDVDGGFWPPW